MDSMGHRGLWPLKYSIIGSHNVADGSIQAVRWKAKELEDGGVGGENPGAAECMTASSKQCCWEKCVHRKDSTGDEGKDRNRGLETLSAITCKGEGRNS